MDTLTYFGCLLWKTSSLTIKENKEVKVKKNIKKISTKFLALC